MKRDLISQSLTHVPAENHKGERLEVCPDCFGSGTYRRSRVPQGLPNGVKFKGGPALTDADVKLFNKKKWGIEYGNCCRIASSGSARACSARSSTRSACVTAGSG